MLNLIKNEYAKIFYKKTTYIILALCLVFGLGISALIHFAYVADYTYEYYSDTTIQEQLEWWQNSTGIYERREYEIYSAYDGLGYTTYREIPAWIRSAVENGVYSHYTYVLISESEDVSKAEEEYGESIEDMDIERERKLYQDILSAVRASDYRAYYQVMTDYYEEQIEKNETYNVVDYEYSKFMLENNINPEENEERIEDFYTYISAKLTYDSLVEAQNAGVNISEYELYTARQKYEIYKYIIDNDIINYMADNTEGYDMEDNIFSINRNSLISALTSTTMISAMAGIFLIIIASGIFSSEYSNGTIKFLLINPVKRAKIFWSKYISCISLFIGSLIIFYIIYFLFSLLLCGTDGLDGIYISYANEAVQTRSILLYSLTRYIMSGVSLITSITLAFTISAFLRSTAIAIAISLVIEFVGSAITTFLYALGHDWGRYLLFSNTDLASIARGATLFPGQTLTFALVTIAIYMAVFLLTAYDGFTKKEI